MQYITIISTLLCIAILIKILRENSKLRDIINANFNINTENNKTMHGDIKHALGIIQNQLLQIQNSQEIKFDMLRNTMDLKITTMQNDNEKRLNQMREVVSEKLESSIEKRLSESFQIISGRLESVYRAMGEVHTLAAGVGDLKRLLSSVNSRGVWGEVQLENILKNILTSNQYTKNCVINPNSRDSVEFAIKLPGRSKNEHVMIPMDAKFPMEAYHRLCTARDNDQKQEIDKLTKEMINIIKKNAKTISEKYIHPPHSTDFAIMFLPVEALYAEVLRIPGLVESIQEQLRVIITGPTTLSAIVNSLNMGFRTLAIQGRASDIWHAIEKISQEFSDFSSLLVKTRLKLEQAGEAIALAERKSFKMKKDMDSIAYEVNPDMLRLDTSSTQYHEDNT